MPVKVVKDQMLETARSAGITGVMVGVSDGSGGGIAIARLVEGESVWREDWTPAEAEAIGKELVRLARQQNEIAASRSSAQWHRTRRTGKAGAS